MEWKREDANLRELVIRVLNKYSYLHNRQLTFDDDLSISFAEAQIIKEIISHEGANMSALAKALGITKAAVTKNIKKLETRDLVQRYKKAGNNKNILLTLTDKGKRTYETYQEYVYERIFKDIFALTERDTDGEDYGIYNRFFESLDSSLEKISDEKL